MARLTAVYFMIVLFLYFTAWRSKNVVKNKLNFR